ncbi:amino acid/amide ABC transporter ATP-binding protein 2, HAAT family [Limimonas halophila]|uniref:Amino acid/amide ABC transporter ATP-binding protein 2, HAAT family n=1 Tax=Limimonas halophila TaxID=1082479 RepID=A0A1G7Q1Z4_9PROT|nr:ABC transporter ATP-binding protein [Limimonas halophila]SDF92505.1 amino acid/amide ABC transporter ATP-binding protein 2, HAAT family [Limimonas halophila]
MLDASELHTFYGESHALHGVSLSVREGETVCLLGRNGAGKTTTLSSLVGIVPPRRGSVHFRGHDITGLPAHEITRRGLCLVPEDRRIFPDLTVAENLEVSRYRGRERAESWTVEGIFDSFSMLAEIRDQPGKTLSGGQQQILAIARALVGQPVLLLLDEPSEGLAPVIVHQIGALIDELAGHTTVLFTDQNLPFAFQHASRCYILEKGHVVYAGTTAELQANPELQDRYLSVA